MVKKAELMQILNHAIEAEEELATHVATGLESLLESFDPAEEAIQIPNRSRLLEIVRIIREDSKRHGNEVLSILEMVSAEAGDDF